MSPFAMKTATHKYNKKAQEQYKQARLNGKSNLQVPRQAKWQFPGREVHQRGLSSIGGTQSLLRGEGHYDRVTDLKWAISDLYCGITPISLIKEWAPLFGTPLSIAHTVIHKFVGHLEKQATELIWKSRCKTTVEREKGRGITARHKKAKYTGPRGEWSEGYGYICEDGYCPCGGRLEDHEVAWAHWVSPWERDWLYSVGGYLHCEEGHYS
ncbi:hypothetical protein EDD21DRAFT_405240 [Dissophora ornata]|nr:hypothetical protein EDD21DRAFT_405240 [Dissophora ornata]